MTTSSLTSPWFPWLEPMPAGCHRLFCLHYAGGGASRFRNWNLGPAISVCPVQLPGRETRMQDPAIANMDAIIDALILAMEPLLQQPFSLFGHSMGGLIAYETQRRLLATGRPTAEHLLVSACKAPQRREEIADLLERDDHGMLLGLEQRYGATISAEERAAQQALLPLIAPTIRADLQLLVDYSPQAHPELPGRLTVFAGDRDPAVQPSDLSPWHDLMELPGRTILLPGDHFSYLHEPDDLLGHIRSLLS